MPNEFLIEGLKYAITKGESLKSAVNSFVNAGYNQAEIEEAARIVQGQKISPLPETVSGAMPMQKLSEQTIFKKPPQGNPIQTQMLQKVSSYEKILPRKSLIIILIILMIVLLGILAGLFLFRDSAINFFNNLF